MKKYLLIFVASAAFNSVNAQDVMYEIHGLYTFPITRDQLASAALIGDFVEGYPSSRISDYTSSEIAVTNNGKTTRKVGNSEVLTLEQRKLLNTVVLESEVNVRVRYRTSNSVTQKLDNRTLDITLTVVPESQAVYPAGNEKLIESLKSYVVSKMPKSTLDKLKEAQVIFTVNEEGKAQDAVVAISSGDVVLDKVLVDAIHQMPKWKPAQNTAGVKVKQRFKFNVGIGGC